MLQKNPKFYWNLLNRKPTQSPKASMDDLVEHLENINSVDGGDHANEFEADGTILHKKQHVEPEAGDQVSFSRNFSADEINGAVNKLKNGKAAGEDGILNEYIKSTSHIFINVHVKLFNQILNSGQISSKWLSGFIVPIY
jgi:hypothetical protein